MFFFGRPPQKRFLSGIAQTMQIVSTHIHTHRGYNYLIVVAQEAELDMAAGVLDTCKQMFFGPSNKT